MELNELLQSASNYGFPMLISCYLLMRMESRMNDLTEALNKLCVALEAQK
ncbi:MAG: YvrJ family protein [Acidaminococcaceae bacterium]|nr:YvrJ family protein [Acidaminococcaceae bacterium]